MARRSRPYSPEEKAAALDLYVEKGVCEAARLSGIDKGTISKWAKALGLASLSTWHSEAAIAAATSKAKRLRKRIQLRLLEKADDLLSRMDEEHIDYKGNSLQGPVKVVFPKAPASACQSYATAAAILIDKYRLEMGEVTGRNELTGKDGAPLVPIVTRIVMEVPATDEGADS